MHFCAYLRPYLFRIVHIFWTARHLDATFHTFPTAPTVTVGPLTLLIMLWTCFDGFEALVICMDKLDALVDLW
jgi:hypothetical protein